MLRFFNYYTTPGAAMMPAELAMEAGLPNWVQFAKGISSPLDHIHPVSKVIMLLTFQNLW